VFNEKILAGLGAGVAKTGRLTVEAIEKALRALQRFTTLARLMAVKELDVIATAATRDAVNGADFIKAAEAICGAPISVLSGAEEGRFAALGVLAGFQQPDGVAGDLGGGSLELTEVTGREVGAGESLKLGSLGLQATSGGSLSAAEEMIRAALETSSVLSALPGRTFYAIGGTWRSLARLRMHVGGYPLKVMHEYRIDAEELLDFLAALTCGPLEQVPGLGVVSRQRQALLPYGALVLNALVRLGRPASVTMSALGLREGRLYARLTAEEREQDPLISAAAELSVLRSRSPAHGEELVSWTEQALAVLGLNETEEERRLRTAACLLADIGWRAHPDHRGEQSLSIISNAGFVGVDHPGRAFLALAIYYRHAGLSERELGHGVKEIAPQRYRKRARALAGAFRVAYLMSGAVAGVLPRITLRRSGEKLELVLPSDLAALAGARPESRFRQFAALGGLSSAIVVEG
jgi:exopolyphosphatase/guanosine-5'-triphosphate,3'-diphosphate pyrophosphatase